MGKEEDASSIPQFPNKIPTKNPSLPYSAQNLLPDKRKQSA
jgi:hypothetical protein